MVNVVKFLDFVVLGPVDLKCFFNNYVNNIWLEIETIAHNLFNFRWSEPCSNNKVNVVSNVMGSNHENNMLRRYKLILPFVSKFLIRVYFVRYKHNT